MKTTTLPKARVTQQMKKFLVFIISGFLMLVVGMAVSSFATLIDPFLNIEYENNAIFRPWSDSLMSLFWLEPFVTAFILLWLWNFTKPLIKGDTIIKRGLSFGFTYWVITIPGMIMSYSSFQISGFMVISWSASILVQSLCTGIFFARVQP